MTITDHSRDLDIERFGLPSGHEHRLYPCLPGSQQQERMCCLYGDKPDQAHIRLRPDAARQIIRQKTISTHIQKVCAHLIILRQNPHLTPLLFHSLLESESHNMDPGTLLTSRSSEPRSLTRLIICSGLRPTPS